MKKAFMPIILFILMFVSLTACGSGEKQEAYDAIAGKYEISSSYSMFPLSELEFYNDGTVMLYMDWQYTGIYKEKNGTYEITIKEGVSAVGGVAAEEAKKAYNIFAELNDDGSLTVFVKAKSGYMYYGSESEVFKRK